jgi:hypothetical protein
MATDFYAPAVRFGMPGKLFAAPLGTTEPADETAAWGVGWIPLGYTSEGSTINYEITLENVEVAEELDVFARVTTGRNATIEVALAEVTLKNLRTVFNGGIIAGDGAAWSLEPPDLGKEQRIMLGWDAMPDVTDNDLRFVFRQCLQGGSIGMANRKGVEKQTLTANFQLEKPSDPTNIGAKLFKIMGAAELNPT